jgi:hypothetical protein
MTNEQTNQALSSVRKHLTAMLQKLEDIKAEQEEDLKSLTGPARVATETSLAQTQKLIDEIEKSKANIEAELMGKNRTL